MSNIRWWVLLPVVLVSWAVLLVSAAVMFIGLTISCAAALLFDMLYAAVRPALRWRARGIKDEARRERALRNVDRLVGDKLLDAFLG